MSSGNNMYLCKTPVAFLIFNRPDTTEMVFREIAKAKPAKLLVVADGPRLNRSDEVLKCAETRAIIERVDWDCEVLINYSDINLGCKNRLASGIDWVLEQVPEAIILEDDCLPESSFFKFCDEMLEKYRNDNRVSHIGGTNFQFGRSRTDASYYFSRYNHVWGWATWRRAWKYYDRDIAIWPEVRSDKWLNSVVHSNDELRYWTKIFNSVYAGRIDTWDYQWNLVSWMQGMVSIVPNVNLISNIGHNIDATHTSGVSIYSAMQTKAMMFPLNYPSMMLPLTAADEYTARWMFTGSLFRRVILKLKAIIQITMRFPV